MLRDLESLINYKLSATDGDIGRVADFYFDDERWAIRYLVAECGSFFSERQALISPSAFAESDWADKRFHVALTREKIKNSPSVDLANPVSRQYEREYLRYYGWPYYWGSGGVGMWGASRYPQALGDNWTAHSHYPAEKNDDPHLRSVNEVNGYHIHGSDGDIGHISGFIWDDQPWAIRYLVVDTSEWWTGKKVLLSPTWISEISWTQKSVSVELPREVIKRSPEWNPGTMPGRGYEIRLHDHYGMSSYWSEDEKRENARIALSNEKHVPHAT